MKEKKEKAIDLRWKINNTIFHKLIYRFNEITNNILNEMF